MTYIYNLYVKLKFFFLCLMEYLCLCKYDCKEELLAVKDETKRASTQLYSSDEDGNCQLCVFKTIAHATRVLNQRRSGKNAFINTPKKL